MTTARNQATDRIRRDRALAAKFGPLVAGNRAELPMKTTTFPDERLELILTCCHPALAVEAQVALTLRTLGGLTTDEIARAFLNARQIRTWVASPELRTASPTHRFHDRQLGRRRGDPPTPDGPVPSPHSGAPSGQAAMQTRLPARSARIHAAGAWESSMMRPPAATAAARRCSACSRASGQLRRRAPAPPPIPREPCTCRSSSRQRPRVNRTVS